MNETLWLDGRFLPPAKALVPVTDRAVQIGFGLFEVLRGYQGVPFLLDRHLARMRKSARHFKLKIPVSDATVHRVVPDLLRRNRLDDAYIRLVVTAGGSFMIRTLPYTPKPKAWYERGAAIRISPWRRDPRGPLYGHKTLNYLENVLTHDAAIRDGFADSIFVGIDGALLEGCVSNLFVVKRGRILTPRLGTILPGVTRQTVMKFAKVTEARLVEKDLHSADEVFLTNALVEVLPVTRLGTRRIGNVGSVTRELMNAYLRGRPHGSDAGRSARATSTS